MRELLKLFGYVPAMEVVVLQVALENLGNSVTILENQRDKYHAETITLHESIDKLHKTIEHLEQQAYSLPVPVVVPVKKATRIPKKAKEETQA